MYPEYTSQSGQQYTFPALLEGGSSPTYVSSRPSLTARPNDWMTSAGSLAEERRMNEESAVDASEGSHQSSSEGDSWAESESGLFSSHRRGACVGYCLQYFTVGFVYGGLPATAYGFFLGYLAVPGYVYATVLVMLMLPWTFKLFFGLMNDTLPICGLRRKPYMVLGWTICASVLVVLWQADLPDPYWCIDAAGLYQRTMPDALGNVTAATPCNALAATEGGCYAVLMMLAALGYVLADVAADGLTAEYAQLEDPERKGSTQTTAYLCRSIGSGIVTVFVGVAMNSKLYNGVFDWGLGFNDVCGVLAVPAALMVPVSACLVLEPSGGARALGRVRCRDYAAQCWDLACNKCFFCVLLFNFLSPLLCNISSTADPLVKQYWAGVNTLQKQVFSLIGSAVFSAGLVLVKQRLLGRGWRKILFVATALVATVELAFTAATIFDVVRNQYFYLASAFLTEVPNAAKFAVSTFVIVEMAGDGNEGMVCSLLTTVANLGSPLSRVIGNQAYRLFVPALSDARNYIEDKDQFRWTVFMSFLLQFGLAVTSLFFLILLPNQKDEANMRKQTWERRSVFGMLTVTLLGLGFWGSLALNFLALFPETMCMQLAGGDGCETPTP